MLKLTDLLKKESTLNDMTAKLLFGRTVRIRGCVESGEFDMMRTVKDIEFVKSVTGNGRCMVTSIHDVKIGSFPVNENNLLDFSCISEMEVARCSNPECGSEIEIEHHEDDDTFWCSRCGNVISKGLDEWVVYRVEATTDKVRLLRV